MNNAKMFTLIFLLIILGSCGSKKLSKAKRITFYNTMIYEFKGSDYPSLDSISIVVSREVSDKTILQCFNSAVRYTDTNTIWKGFIIAKVVFENEKIAWVKISRHGSFFIDTRSKTYYKIEDQKNKDNWENFIDEFLNERKITQAFSPGTKMDPR